MKSGALVSPPNINPPCHDPSNSSDGPLVMEVRSKMQFAKKVVFDSLGPLNFAIGLVNSVVNMP